MSDAPQQPPTITMPLADYLEDIFTYCRERSIAMVIRACVSKAKGERIKEADPAEQYCHIEINEHGVATIYPIKEWLETEMALLEKKKRSAAETAKKYKTLEDIQSLATELGKDELFGSMMSMEQLRVLAKKIIVTGDVATARKFGVEL